MRMFYRRLGIYTSSLLCMLACLSVCESGGHFTLFGYTTRPPVDESIRNVYVPTPENVTYHRWIEAELHRAVVRELGTSPYRVTSNRSCADTELLMKVVGSRKNVILQNQLGETRDAEIGLEIEVVWRDLRPGHAGDILSNRKRFDPNELPLPGESPAKAPTAVPLRLTPTATYVPELGGSNASANALAVSRAARQVVQMMEIWR